MPEAISSVTGFSPDPIDAKVTAHAAITKGDTFALTRIAANTGRGLNTTVRGSTVDTIPKVYAVALEDALSGAIVRVRLRGTVKARVLHDGAAAVSLNNSNLVHSAHDSGRNTDALVGVGSANTPSVTTGVPLIIGIMIDENADGGLSADGLREVIFDGLNGLGSIGI